MDSTILTAGAGAAIRSSFPQALQAVLQIVIPYIKKLIESKVVPTIKRKVYERLDGASDALIKDLAQNASKIANEQNEIKKAAYIEGTKLGLDTLRAISEKLSKAADEIEKAAAGVAGVDLRSARQAGQHNNGSVAISDCTGAEVL